MHKKMEKLDCMRQYLQRVGGGSADNLRKRGGHDPKLLISEHCTPAGWCLSSAEVARIYAGWFMAVFLPVFSAYISISLIINLKERDIRGNIREILSAGWYLSSAGWYISSILSPQVGILRNANLRKAYLIKSMAYVKKQAPTHSAGVLPPPSFFLQAKI